MENEKRASFFRPYHSPSRLTPPILPPLHSFVFPLFAPFAINTTTHFHMQTPLDNRRIPSAPGSMTNVGTATS